MYVGVGGAWRPRHGGGGVGVGTWAEGYIGECNVEVRVWYVGGCRYVVKVLREWWGLRGGTGGYVGWGAMRGG